MRPAADAGRPSCLAMNPRNREASAARRARLLAAFGELDEDTRADLLEAAESLAFTMPGGQGRNGSEVRDIFWQVYALAGWNDREPGS